ncbi:MAG: hypothetical protein PWR01_1049 [Clostridiales bacterium]|nr:hypothetical protein [Clostridiales bacterium]
MSRYSRVMLGVRIAFAYVGTVIGAGFASGQEILQFFTMYGKRSAFSILLAAFLFVWVGVRVLKMGFELRARSFRDTIKLVFGRLSPFVNVYLLLAIMMVAAAMLAGAGALFEEYIRIPFYTGVAITAVVVWVFVAFGLKGIFAINAWIIPVILIFNVFVFAYSLQMDDYTYEVMPVFDVTVFDIVKAGISYASFNIVLAVGVLTSAGSGVDDPRVLKMGGVLGGVILGAMLLMSNYSLMRYVPEIYEFEVPMLYIVHRMGPFFCAAFAVVMWGAILTTLVANVFSVACAVNDIFKLPVHAALLMTIVACVALSFVGFSRIVAFIYPLLGVIGFIVIAVMIFLTKK